MYLVLNVLPVLPTVILARALMIVQSVLTHLNGIPQLKPVLQVVVVLESILKAKIVQAAQLTVTSVLMLPPAHHAKMASSGILLARLVNALQEAI